MTSDELEIVGDASDLIAVEGEEVRPRRKRSVVGYLRGRGGPATASPEEALAALVAELECARGMLEELVEEAVEVEKAFAEVRSALQRTQPPMFGRMVVSWWKLRAGGKRVPVLVQVKGDARGNEKPVRVDRRARLRKDGGFALNHDLNQRAVDLYWALWGLRCEVHDDLARLAQVLRRRRTKAKVIAARVAEVKAVRAEAVRRLKLVGYEVEEGEEEEAAS